MALDALREEAGLSAEQLAERYGGKWKEHPEFAKDLWRYEVGNEDTVLGYWEWVQRKVLAEVGEQEELPRIDAGLEDLQAIVMVAGIGWEVVMAEAWGIMTEEQKQQLLNSQTIGSLANIVTSLEEAEGEAPEPKGPEIEFEQWVGRRRYVPSETQTAFWYPGGFGIRVGETPGTWSLTIKGRLYEDKGVDGLLRLEDLLFQWAAAAGKLPALQDVQVPEMTLEDFRSNCVHLPELGYAYSFGMWIGVEDGEFHCQPIDVEFKGYGEEFRESLEQALFLLAVDMGFVTSPLAHEIPMSQDEFVDRRQETDCLSDMVDVGDEEVPNDRGYVYPDGLFIQETFPGAFRTQVCLNWVEMEGPDGLSALEDAAYLEFLRRKKLAPKEAGEVVALADFRKDR